MRHRLLIVATFLVACGSRSGALRTSPDADTAQGAVDGAGPAVPSDAGQPAPEASVHEDASVNDGRMAPVDAFVPSDTRIVPHATAKPEVGMTDAGPVVVDSAPARDSSTPDAPAWQPVRIDPSLNLGSDIVIYQNKDRGPADAQCLADSAAWLSLAYEFIAEDRECTDDSDCVPTSFGDLCGSVCVFPINKLRTGEFGNHVMKFGSENCTTCPAGAIPPCRPPRATFCNAGRCEYSQQ